MPRTIKLADLTAEPVQVELGEYTYTLKPVTRSVQKKFDAVDQQLRALADEDDSDKIVAVFADGLDALLEPTAAKQPAAKKVITDAWKADEISLAAIQQLVRDLQNAERPT